MRPVVVFDLDGTLVDSLPGIVESFRAAFAARGLPPPPPRAVYAQIGKPLESMCAAFAEPQEVPRLAAAYRAHYLDTACDTSRAFPGVADVLATLGARGVLRVVATTKRSDLARRMATAAGLDDVLDHVQGTDGFAAKPAPDVVHRAIAAVGGRGLWMVGDTVHDVEAGRAAGISTYAVTWPGGDGSRVRAARPDVVAPDLGRLLDLCPA